MAVCNIEDCDQHYGCRLKAKGVGISPRATMTRTQNWRPTPSVAPKSNGALMYEDRPGGTKMPILNADGSQLYRRDYLEKQHQIDQTIRQLRNSGTAPKD